MKNLQRIKQQMSTKLVQLWGNFRNKTSWNSTVFLIKNIACHASFKPTTLAEKQPRYSITISCLQLISNTMNEAID